jgi:hypothetical protein
MLIGKGDIKLIGGPSEVANLYTIDNVQVANKSKRKDEARDPSEFLEFMGIKLSKSSYSQNEKLRFDVIYELRKSRDIDLGISVLYKGVSIIENNTIKLKLNTAPGKKHKISYQTSLKALNPGVYRVDVAVFDKPSFSLITFVSDAASFVIEQKGALKGGLLSEQGEWL